MSKASVNGVIRPTGKTGSAGVMSAVLGVAAVLVGVIVVVAGSPESAAVADPGTRASAVRAIAPTTSTTPPPPTPPTTAPGVAPPATIPPPPRPAVTTGCGDALAYLAAHQAPGFVDYCGDGSALGHYGYTCWNVAGTCPDGAKVIHIACPAPFVYMNEAHNSWTVTGQGSGIDPYGQGSPSEQAFCAAHRE